MVERQARMHGGCYRVGAQAVLSGSPVRARYLNHRETRVNVLNIWLAFGLYMTRSRQGGSMRSRSLSAGKGDVTPAFDRA